MKKVGSVYTVPSIFCKALLVNGAKSEQSTRIERYENVAGAASQ